MSFLYGLWNQYGSQIIFVTLVCIFFEFRSASSNTLRQGTGRQASICDVVLKELVSARRERRDMLRLLIKLVENDEKNLREIETQFDTGLQKMRAKVVSLGLQMQDSEDAMAAHIDALPGEIRSTNSEMLDKVVGAMDANTGQGVIEAITGLQSVMLDAFAYFELKTNENINNAAATCVSALGQAENQTGTTTSCQIPTEKLADAVVDIKAHMDTIIVSIVPAVNTVMENTMTGAVNEIITAVGTAKNTAATSDNFIKTIDDIMTQKANGIIGHQVTTSDDMIQSLEDLKFDIKGLMQSETASITHGLKQSVKALKTEMDSFTGDISAELTNLATCKVNVVIAKDNTCSVTAKTVIERDTSCMVAIGNNLRSSFGSRRLF